ncbi:hypothetical protein NQ317_015650 [Molorchus minor]|uniref:Ig-like domain-containing protein n=1 Tax=Molorchus minor TaxID=1323400 RepID=A0ABQ9JMN2_9CUCU|nr:hypothetical protein NQ317_015650 [Molorchus minor]
MSEAPTSEILFEGYHRLKARICSKVPHDLLRHTDTDKRRRRGGRVSLLCSVHPRLPRTVDEGGQELELQSAHIYGELPNSARLQIFSTSRSGESNLLVANQRHTRNRCRSLSVSNHYFSEQSSDREVEVQVRRPLLISDNSTRSVVVSEGEAVEMECYAGGYPPPKISWRRENNAILPTGGSIYRGNKIGGTYYCVAENGVGRGTKRNIAVEVEFAPVVVVPRPRLGQALQFDMDLECHVEAYPPPAISWEKDEVTLSNNQHYKISHFAVADEFTDTTLRVISIEKRQYGYYTCKAANKLGTSEGKVNLFETVVPVCPPACGSARYAEAATLSTSTAALFITLIICVIRNFQPQH